MAGGHPPAIEGVEMGGEVAVAVHRQEACLLRQHEHRGAPPTCECATPHATSALLPIGSHMTAERAMEAVHCSV